jgi:hypothetical protein
MGIRSPLGPGEGGECSSFGEGTGGGEEDGRRGRGGIGLGHPLSKAGG